MSHLNSQIGGLVGAVTAARTSDNDNEISSNAYVGSLVSLVLCGLCLLGLLCAWLGPKVFD